MMAKKQTFQQSMDRLDDIVSAMEKNDMELEAAIVLFEEGLQLRKSCDQQLKGFEERVSTLISSYEEEVQDADI